MGANLNIGDFASGGGRLNPQTGEFNPTGGIGQVGNAIRGLYAKTGPDGTGPVPANLPEGYTLTPQSKDLFRAYSAVQPKDGFMYAYGPQGDRIEVPVAQPLRNVSNSSVGYGQFPLTPNTLGSRSFSNVFDVQSGDSDYARAAKLTAQGNLAAAQAQATANRVNQINPYGSIQYYQTGVDAQGNPTYSAAAALAPEQQALLDAQNFQSLGLAQTANRALGNVYNTYGRAFDISPFMQQEVGQGPQFENLGQANPMLQAGATEQLQRGLDQNAGMAGWDRASNLIMQRLEPQMQRQQERLNAQLAAQGIPVGSEAYTRAQQDLAQQQNDLRTQAQLQAQGIQQNLFGQELAGGQFRNLATTQQQQNLLQNLGFTNEAMQQDFANRQAQLAFNNQLGQQGYQNQLARQQANNLARQNNFALASYLRGLPMQELNALRAGSQVTNPSFIGVPQTGQVAGPDLLSAYQAQQNANIAQQNRQAAQQSNLTSGLFSLGGSLLGNIGGVANTVGNVLGGVGNAVSRGVQSVGNAIGRIFSDSRLKENIKAIGVMPNGLTLYSFEYKDEVKNHPMGGDGVHVGVMADEVEKVFPYAVSTLDDGYKVVDYRLLP